MENIPFLDLQFEEHPKVIINRLLLNPIKTHGNRPIAKSVRI
ncbi:MAG: hypothetical protein ACJAWV_000852 [Flammeovirgaceae bacterium]|jgi:hypothetical protein